MALIRCNGSGAKVKHGTFTSANSETTINVGFKPKYLYIANDVTRVVNIYDEDISTTSFMYAGASASVSDKNLGGTGTYEIKSINNDGFTINAMPATGNPVYYLAVG